MLRAPTSSTINHDLRQLVERLPLPTVLNTLHESPRILLVNEAFVQTFGYTVDDIPTVGDWAKKAYPDETYRRETLAVWGAAVAKAQAETGRVESMELRVSCRDGTIRDVVISAVVADEFLMVTLIDVSERRRAEKELRAAVAEVREQERRHEEAHRRDLEEKLKTSLTAAAAAHEIKQPLSRILLETQVALERLRERSFEPADVGRYLEDMLTESRHVVDMLGRMRSLLRNVQSTHSIVALPEVVASAILFSRALLTRHEITLRERGLDQNLEILGDGVQLQTAVINLIRNAAEALAEEPADRRLISVEVVSGDDRAEIIVGDAGPGMSAEKLAAGPLASSKPDGTGLGLYLVRTCMENHGGSVSVGRSPLGGAEVRLILPRQRTGRSE
ncbi:MAG: PAS domain-containing sensor histidine kinase [Planctomycetia bacterium]|nr:PAS domain-containing sensor histidine kinase [Planctomycetia bacterium]